MIDQVNTAEIDAFALRDFANRPFVSQQTNPGNTTTRTHACRNYRSRIVTFGQDNVLWFRRGPLANLLKYGHEILWLNPHLPGVL